VISRILFPSDLGLFGRHVLNHVMCLAERYEARVRIVHAVEPMGVFADTVLDTYIPEELIHELRLEGQREVMSAIQDRVEQALEDEFVDGHFDLKWVDEVSVVLGDAADCILNEAELYGSDLIVMGAHSHSSDRSNLLGAVASRVLQLSCVPIYLVPVGSQSTCQHTT
jgi:nucleotide-binding universal stress UspA family protein